jgi:hypothetical protein
MPTGRSSAELSVNRLAVLAYSGPPTSVNALGDVVGRPDTGVSVEAAAMGAAVPKGMLLGVVTQLGAQE